MIAFGHLNMGDELKKVKNNFALNPFTTAPFFVTFFRWKPSTLPKPGGWRSSVPDFSNRSGPVFQNVQQAASFGPAKGLIESSSASDTFNSTPSQSPAPEAMQSCSFHASSKRAKLSPVSSQVRTKRKVPAGSGPTTSSLRRASNVCDRALTGAFCMFETMR